ncbi:MAG: UbiA family prenyltransferase, partial [Saccharospirillum sp.]
MSKTVAAPVSHRAWQDYYEMTKPKVVMLMLITAWVGMALAPQQGMASLANWVFGTLGIAALAAAGAAFNHLVDHKIDQLMARTHRRPVATGRVSQRNGLIFAFSLTLLGFAVLMVF